MEKKLVQAKYKNRDVIAEFYYSTEPPWRLRIKVDNVFKFSSEEDFFECFKKARTEAEKINLFFYCNGARRNVYPSNMTRGMNGGLLAYVLTKGKPASKKDIVNIFDETKFPIVSPKEQEKFFSEWLESL